jgi:RND family efflux transporter MFP subunit
MKQLQTTTRLPLAAALFASAVLAAGCGGKDAPEAGAAVRRTPVTVATATRERVDAAETTVGRIEATASPALAAETSGRVVRLLVDGGSVVRQGQVLAELDGEPQRLAVASARASVERLEALLANQQRTVNRYQELRSKAVSESMLEEALAQQSAREAELNDARARLAEAQYRLDRTRIRSPVDAVVERRLISVGDFVAPGTPVVTIVGKEGLRAVLPFPERLSGQLRPGLAVTLEQPARPGAAVTGTVTEVRPMVGTNNRAVEALVDLPPESDWPPGGSVTARIVLASRDGVVVPAGSVVRRPAGDVVYAVGGEKVAERKVTVGIRDAERAEILGGVEAGETVVVSGAGFLTDGALVAPREPAAGAPAGGGAATAAKP